MNKKGLKVASIGMLTCAIVLGTATGITSFAGYDGKLIGKFDGNDANLTLASVEVPEEAKNYANDITGVLLADVYGNEDGFDVTIEDYSKITLGQPYTVMSQAEEMVYSFPVMEGSDIKMILNVFEEDGEWNATLGKNYAEELNELQERKDETFMLYVEDGNIVAKSENDKILMEKTNYEYDETADADFDSDTTYEEIVETVEQNTESKVEETTVTDEFVEAEEIQNTMAQYNQQFYTDYQRYFGNWFSRWWRRWQPVSPTVTPKPATPTAEPDDILPTVTTVPVTKAPATKAPATKAPATKAPATQAPSNNGGIGAYSDKPFSVDTATAKTLNTSGCAVLQQDQKGTERGLCWAATTATIVNYRSGKKQLEAYNVADYMGIGYDQGGTLNDIKNAIGHYGFSYTAVQQQISLNNVISMIDAKKPIAMCAYASAGGHAVTIVGYSNATNNQTVTIWNSGNHQMQTCTYQSSGTSFTYGGYKFTWYGTVYPN